MRALSAILFLVIVTQRSSAYKLEPTVSWPDEYHFNVEEINMESGLVKTFEMWYSSEKNSSRIDLYDGVSQRYYNSEFIYFFHPQTVDGDISVMKCMKMHNYWGEQEDFLPDIEYYTYAGEAEVSGKKVSVWKNDIEDNESKSEDTFYVYQIADGVHIPVQLVKKSFNLQSGERKSYQITNYYNYHGHIDQQSLEADDASCKGWDPYEDDSTSIKYLMPDFRADVETAFLSFKRHHNRYYDDSEHELRKQIFRHNWKRVTDHNSKNLGYTLALNKYADWTKDELKYLAATKYTDPIRGAQPFPHNEQEVAELASEIPESYDLRIEGVITPVRDQGNCGSCWAFATAATLEGALARANGGHLIDLSEQSLVDCAWQYRSHGCEGTEAIDAVIAYLMKYGLPTVQEYGPYLEEDGFCRIENMTDVVTIKGFAEVTPLSTNALKVALFKYGPVTVGVEVTGNMVLYNSGVFYDMECSPGRMNHAVTLVGYGVQDGELYWLIKNSWGETWGEAGFILISAKDNNCNVMNTPVYPLL